MLNLMLISNLKSFSAQTGLPEELWLQVEKAFDGENFSPDSVHQIKTIIPQIAEMALEAGFYQLALNLGLASPFDQGRAYLFLADRNNFQDLLLNTADQSIQLILKVTDLRIQGQSERAVQMIMSNFSQMSYSLENIGDAYLQIASCFFNTSQYKLAFENYVKAFEIFKNQLRKGKMAISAFNAGIALSNLDKKSESQFWFWQSREILKSYKLFNLEKSNLLYQIESAVSEKGFEDAIILGQEFLNKFRLSNQQKILCHQALATAYLEIGNVTESEAQSALARHLIQKFHHLQYELFQAALESNIQTVLYRQIIKNRSLSQNNGKADLRALQQFRIAQARLAVNTDQQKFNRILKEMDRAQGDLPEDLEFHLRDSFYENFQTARACEYLLLKSLRTKKIGPIHKIISQLEGSKQNKWQEALFYLAQGFLAFWNNDKQKSQLHASLSLKICNEQGLEKLTSFALGLCATVDSHFQKEWLFHFESLEPIQRNQIKDFFLQSLGSDLSSKKWFIAQDLQGILQDTKSLSSYDLIIDESAGKVTFQNNILNFGKRPVLLKLLNEIAKASVSGLSKEQILFKVWGYDYNPIVHDSLVFSNLKRLREILPIELFENKYRISPTLNWVFVCSEETSTKQNLSERESKLIEFMKEQNRRIQRKSVVAHLNVSERTALRELTDLVKRGLIEKIGAGRSASYQLLQKGLAV